MRRVLVFVVLALLGTACSEDAEVPDVTGLQESEATTQLNDAGYDVRVDEEYQEGAELGEVLAQRPAPDSPHETDRPVQLTVAAEYLSPEVTGSFSLFADENSMMIDEGTCAGSGGYSDINSAAQVVIRDEQGTVLATSHLGDGMLIDSGVCYFEFTLGSLPRANFYSIEVGRRGELTYSFADLENSDWGFEASLGNP